MEGKQSGYWGYSVYLKKLKFHTLYIVKIQDKDVSKRRFSNLDKFWERHVLIHLCLMILPNHYTHPGYHEMRTHRRGSVHCLSPLDQHVVCSQENFCR